MGPRQVQPIPAGGRLSFEVSLSSGLLALLRFLHCPGIRFFHKNPRDLFALLVILVIWGFQDRSLAISTPRYNLKSLAAGPHITEKYYFFFYFSTKTYVVGTQKNCLNETQKNCLNETVLLSTQNTCLY